MKHAVQIQQEPSYQERRLTKRLDNWGDWNNYKSKVGPQAIQCVSIESHHEAEAGDTTEENRQTTPPVPDVEDAEKLNELIKQLSPHMQYVLALSYGGMPCVMRWRRVGDFALRQALENAHTLLHEMIKKS